MYKTSGRFQHRAVSIKDRVCTATEGGGCLRLRLRMHGGVVVGAKSKTSVRFEHLLRDGNL